MTENCSGAQNAQCLYNTILTINHCHSSVRVVVFVCVLYLYVTQFAYNRFNDQKA